MNTGRTEVNYSLIPNIMINPFWLLERERETTEKHLSNFIIIWNKLYNQYYNI